MPDEINQEVEALNKLISALENSKTNLEEAGLSVESLVSLINDLKAAVTDTVAVIPQLNQLADALDRVEGKGGRQRMGGIGQRRFDLAAKGTALGREREQAPAEPTTPQGTMSFEEYDKSLEGASAQTDALSGSLKGLEAEFNRASKEGVEFGLEIRLIKDSLQGLGVADQEIKRITNALIDVGKVESPKELFDQLRALDLPDEEVEKFSKSFLTLRQNSDVIDDFGKKLKSLGIPKESIEKIIQPFLKMGVSLERIGAGMGKASGDTQKLTTNFTTAAGATGGYVFSLDKVSKSLTEVSKTTTKAKSEMRQFAEALKTRGGLSGRRQMVTEVFGKEGVGAGATGFTKIRFEELEGGITKLTTTLKIGERGTQNYTRYINELGQVVKQVGQSVEKSPLRRFMQDMKSFQVPRGARKQIAQETFGEGQELSAPRLKEMEGGFTRISGTIKAAGGATKEYTVYVNQLGQVLKRLPIKEATVSITDFNNQLSGRVGAIQNVTKMLEKYKFQLTDLKKMTTEASTGITRLDFAMKGQGGATQKLTLHVTSLGKVLTDTQRRFRTFAGGIGRNIGESFKWAIAITAIYGPLRKLQDLVQLSIDNESKLADIGVVLGKNTGELQDIFEAAAKAAQATGESLNGVIEGYSLAYRATGNIANQTERARVANQLLIDSLVLSKLSTIDQAEAMDTLVAGLLQAGYSLDQGSELLNKWVAVSKAANVSVDTLASSFAIMATAGEGVGLSFDEINAIVAVVAAKTELSATQAGNAVRAFVSGFQTKNAVEELAKYGIAVQNLEGESRDFMAVMLDIKQLTDAGLIDDAELNKLGTALGGRGARRGAQFTTFLKSLDDVQGLVTVSAEAQADAYDALGIKMNTVQTAITNLATQFQVLANAVGTDGGLLDLLKGLLGVLSDITEAATSFVAVMGKAAPFLAAAGGLYAYGRSVGRVQQMPQQFGGFVGGAMAQTGFGQRPGFQQRGTMGIRGVGMQAGATGNTMAQAWGKQARIMAPGIGLLAAQGMMAHFNIQEKDWDGLGAQIGGGVFGFLVGGPIGSIIGSVIAETIVNGLQAAGQSGELADAFKGVFRGEETEEEDEETDLSREERLLEREEQLNKDLRSIVGGEWLVGINLFAKEADNFLNGLIGLPKQWQDDLTGAQVAGGMLSGAIEAFEEGGAERVRELPGRGALGIDSFTSDEEIEQLIESYRELLKEIEDVSSQLDALGKGFEPEGTPLDVELTDNLEKYGDLLRDEIVRAQGEFNEELIAGDITIKKYRESLERMGTDGEAVAQIFSALDDVLGNSAETLILTLDVISRTSTEEFGLITNLTSGIGDLKQQIAELESEGDIDMKLIAEGELEAAMFELEHVFNAIRSAQREPLIQFDAPVELDTRSIEDHNRVVAESMRILEEDMQESIRLGLIPSDTTIKEVLATHDAIAVAIAGKYVETMQIPMSIYKQAQENLAIPGRIAPPVAPAQGIDVRTIEQSQGAFMAAYEKQLQFLKSAFGDLYQGDFSTVGIIFEDGVDVLHLDNLAMQLAMNDLIDVNQKQLEGVYNLPTDASFYVPFQGYKLGFGEGGGGGLGGAATELKTSSNNLDRAARALERIERIRERERLLGRIPKEPLEPSDEIDRGFQVFKPKTSVQDLIGPWELDARERITEPPIGPWKQEGEDTLIDKLTRWAGDLDGILKGYFGVDTSEKSRDTESTTFFEQLGAVFQKWIPLPEAGKIPGVGLGGGIGTEPPFSKLDSASTKLENVATMLQPTLLPIGPAAPFGGGTSDLAADFGGMLDLLNQKISNLSGFTTNLKISSTSTTNLIVDGRTLAQVIKPYLYSDLIRFEDSGGSITTTIVV